MNLLSRFLEFISYQKLFSSKDKLLLAVSGGLDSSVLCELCHRAGFHFIIGHCNFQLRGEESERDEEFVRRLGKKYGVEVFVKRFETSEYAENKKVSIQLAARQLRYAWFEEIVNRESSGVNRESTGDRRLPTADFILTAHHLDDNIETVLMNFFKGTGIAGLRGMLPLAGRIIRPLLFAKKEELLEYARELNLEYVEDSSNQSEKYSRNYFRLQVIPLIEKIYPGAISNIAHNATRFQEIEILYRQAIDLHKKKLVEKKGTELHIPVEKLRRTEPIQTVVYEIIREFGFSTGQTTSVLELMDSESGRYVLSTTHRILKNRNWLIISPLYSKEQGVVVIGDSEQVVEFPNGQLELERIRKATGYRPSPDDSVACLDSSDIQFPLLLRRWRKGDYFYPLGMQKKKKLARFLIDQKLSLNEKENVWVLEMDRRILWVIGKRIDHRFRITDQTKEILEIKLKAF
jgi:tRNA(Ile)-lysidine synthase